MADYPDKETQPIVHKDFGTAIKRMYPSAVFPDDVIVVDHGGGSRLARWNLPYSIPTNAEIEAALEKTIEELAAEAERAAQQALRTEAKATAMFAAIQNATLTQIDNWIDTNFPALNAQQRALLKVLTAAAGAYLRERG